MIQDRIRRSIVTLALLLLAPSLVYPQENALIVGAETALRAEPSPFGEILANLAKGTRMEVLFVTGFSGIVDGEIGSWCSVASGSHTGFVFGPHLKLDAGPLPLIEGPVYRGSEHLAFYCAQTIRHLFGDDEATVRRKLGEPDEVHEGAWGKCVGVRTKTLRFPGVEVELFYPVKECGFASEREFISKVTISDSGRRILGLGVGDSLHGVLNKLGYEYRSDTLGTDLYVYVYPAEEHPFHMVSFVVRTSVKGNAVESQEVVEIRFETNILGD
ncbi:hypothetical protein JXA88_13260 [Candidatus Fermentibacteria bacterium]|nr:hypothetical protein [Candidatus Fermentibacteria bacterium]